MPSIKEAMAERITSKEQFDNALRSVESSNGSYLGRAEKRADDNRTVLTSRRHYNRAFDFYDNSGYRLSNAAHADRYVYMQNLPQPTGTMVGTLHHTRWWTLRDTLRLIVGLREVPDVLMGVCKRFPDLGIHVNPSYADDPLAVWYTPDAPAGERDAPVRTTMARLVRKLYPAVDDDVITAMDAEFRAEMSNEVEIVPPERIAETYITGPSSCMSHAASRWNEYGLGGVHPTEVYNAPGFGLAISRDAAGEINGRCLVWVNPEDEADKRAVRFYGDRALQRRLLKKGFRVAGLRDVRLKRINLGGAPSNHAKVVMPYIDAPGGGSTSEMTAQHVVLDGPDWVRVVKSDQGLGWTLRQFNGAQASPATGTCGFAQIPLVSDLEAMNVTCALTGVKIGSAPQVKIWKDGTAVPVLASADLSDYPVETYLRNDNGTNMKVMAPAGTATFSYGGTPMIDTEGIRAACGHYRLSQEFYPENTWAHSTETLCDIDGERIKADDAADRIEMVHDIAQRTTRHITTVVGKDWVRCHRVNAARPTYAHKDVPIITTRSGRRVVLGVHDVEHLIDGTYDFERNIISHQMYGTTIAWAKGTVPGIDAVVEKLKVSIKTLLNNTVDAYYLYHDIASDYAEGSTWAEYEKNRLRQQLMRSYSYNLGVAAMVNEGTTDIRDLNIYTSSSTRFDENRQNYELMVASAQRLAADPSSLPAYSYRHRTIHSDIRAAAIKAHLIAFPLLLKEAMDRVPETVDALVAKLLADTQARDDQLTQALETADRVIGATTASNTVRFIISA